MNPETLLSYYPSYSILDEVVSGTGCNLLNIFIDLKNNLQTLYMKEPIYAIVENSLNSRFVDTSIFTAVISFLSFHKIYSMKRPNLKIKTYLFFESGRSVYHQNISKKYKISRKIDDLYGLDREKRDYFFEILQKNYLLLERVCNRIPDTKLIRLSNMEADFIPYYLIRNNLVDSGDNVANLIYSNDHDLLQCLSLEGKNYVFSKSYNSKKIVRKGESIKSYLKYSTEYPDSLLSLAMSVIGDTGDDVDGVRGIGPKRLEPILWEIVNCFGGMDNLRDNVFHNRPIFVSPPRIENKYLNMIKESEETLKTVSTNMKLIDFELISRALDEPVNTEMIDRRKGINESLEPKAIYPLKDLKPALELNGVFLQNELDIIYQT